MLGSALVAHTQPAGKANVGEAVFDSPGTYSWTVPEGVTCISVVWVDGGGAAQIQSDPVFFRSGDGGDLGFKNNVSVTPGESLTVIVGAGGSGRINEIKSGGSSSVITSASLVADGGGEGGAGQLRNVANGSRIGGGGAGGYSGPGGTDLSNLRDGQGGGGAAGAGNVPGGGGVGLYGEGPSGVAPGGGGSGGETATTGAGGSFGGGAGYPGSKDGASGAVRIVWPGDKRQFPSTLVDKR